jgi:hypothetical protein
MAKSRSGNPAQMSLPLPPEPDATDCVARPRLPWSPAPTVIPCQSSRNKPLRGVLGLTRGRPFVTRGRRPFGRVGFRRTHFSLSVCPRGHLFASSVRPRPALRLGMYAFRKGNNSKSFENTYTCRFIDHVCDFYHPPTKMSMGYLLHTGARCNTHALHRDLPCAPIF